MTVSTEININMAVVLGQGITTSTHLTLNENLLESVDRFGYFGSAVTSTFSMKSIQLRRKAVATFGELKKMTEQQNVNTEDKGSDF